MIITVKTNNIKKISLFLFLLSLFSLLGSLWLHNTLVNFSFTKDLNDKKINITQDYYSDTVICSKNIKDCRGGELLNKLTYSKKLGNCFANQYKIFYVANNKVYESRLFFFNDNNRDNNLKTDYIDKEIKIIIKNLGIKNINCIKNSDIFYIYKIIPFYFEFLYDLKHHPKTSFGTSAKINPFIYGETSISNIAKRFPVNIVFKSFLFISVLLMYLYWNSYKNFFSRILNVKNYKFFYFGIASAIFLFFHVLFLGVEIDNKIFKLLRKIIIVLFILSEILAQYFLTFQLIQNKKKLNYYCYNYIINFKVTFIIIISVTSFFVISLLAFYDLTNKVDYILEWNYFAGLLFYYFLSFLMWKNKTT